MQEINEKGLDVIQPTIWCALPHFIQHFVDEICRLAGNFQFCKQKPVTEVKKHLKITNKSCRAVYLPIAKFQHAIGWNHKQEMK